MKWLVTGGCGFIGTNFIHHILQQNNDIELLNVDKLTYAGNKDNLKRIENDRRYSFVKGDIADEDLITAKDAIDKQRWNSGYKSYYDVLHELVEAFLFFDKIK